jgi:Ion channel
MQAAGTILGLLLLAVVLGDAFEVMLLPRRVRRKMRLVTYLLRSTWFVWSSAARSLRPGPKRDSFLSLYGPLSLLMLIGVWVAGLIAAFGIISWAASLDPVHGVLNHLYFSGITFFTVGYGDLTPKTPWAKIGAVIEAGTGLAFLGTVIGYLPVLYQLFSRREIQVIMLDARAGSPPTATALLTRHAHGESIAGLQELLHEWESWFALVLESHLSYPMLSYYRSQHDNESWIAGLAAIMDTCALILVGLHEVSTFQARVTFAAARLALVEVNRALRLSPGIHSENRLTSSEFNDMKADLLAAGLAFTDEENAEERLAEFRATYEPFLAGLADHLLLHVPGWIAPKVQLDNWQASPRGRSAKQLVESAPVNPS